MAGRQLSTERPRRSRRSTDQPKSLVDQVVDAITEQVMDGRVSPAATLSPEAELARRYHVSRTVIREAMRLLSDRGIVEVTHGKKPRVCEPSAKITVRSLTMLLRRGVGSLQDLVEVRIPLEGEIASLAAKRRTAADLRSLRECLSAQELASTLEDQIEQDMRFHGVLANATGNVMFKLLLETVGDLLAASRRRTLGRMGNERALLHHHRILKAVIARNASGARRAMADHLRMTRKDLDGDASPDRDGRSK